jgi:predicted enzyme related to lactoylglutathione lyase
MTLSLVTLTIDCHDPKVLADFWCEALGYRLDEIDEEGAVVEPSAGPGWAMLFLVVPDEKRVKNRLHLDLRPSGAMATEVARLERLGATSIARVDEGGSFWTVMGDPEGNEFCVLRGPEDGWSGDNGPMLSVDALVIDGHVPRLLADFWCAALDYRLDEIDEQDAIVVPASGQGWTMLFQTVPEDKVVKNRFHLDVRPSGSIASEVARMERLGAVQIRRVEEGDSFWTVMGDPEGNEFCVLRGPEDGWSGEL